MTRRKRWFQSWIPRYLLTLMAVALMIHSLDFRLIAKLFRSAQPFWIGAATVAFGLELGLASWKSAWLFGNGATRLRQFQSYCAKLFVNHFLPGGVGGEAARIFWIGQDSGGLGRAAAVVLMDRLSGLCLQLLLSTAAFFWLAHPNQVANQMANQMVLRVLGVSLLLACLGAFALPAFFKKTLPTLARQMRRFGNLEFPDEGGEAREFELGWRQTMLRPGRLVRLLLISSLRQVAILMLLLSSSRAVGTELPLLEAPPILLLATLSTLAPLTLGNLGVTEGAYALGFVFFGFSAESGVAASLVMRLLTLPIAGLGGWFLSQGGVKRKNQVESSVANVSNANPAER